MPGREEKVTTLGAGSQKLSAAAIRLERLRSKTSRFIPQAWNAERSKACVGQTEVYELIVSTTRWDGRPRKLPHLPESHLEACVSERHRLYFGE